MFKFRNKPSFLIIGAQKAGTSSLFHYLSQHPNINLPSNKELHFFDLNYEKGIDWYESLFPGRTLLQRQLTGEASPYYLFHPLVASRVHLHYPHIKLIVLLRNPVDRAYSHFQMERSRCTEPEPSFIKAVELEHERTSAEEQQLLNGEITHGNRFQNWSYIKRGMYGQQIKHWLSYFCLNQFLFIKSENFYADPVSQLAVVHKFLGVPHIAPADLYAVNANKYPDLRHSDREILSSYFEEDGLLLRRLIGEHFSWT